VSASDPLHTERVRLPGRETEVRIGTGLLAGLWSALRQAFPRAERCGLAVDERVAALWPLPAAPADLEVVAGRLPAGEAAKTREVLAHLQDRWIDLRRDEPVVVMGGGAALDVGGLAAATVRRGLPWIGVPTTVVGMADASVGGKTAVNHPRGKNLLGTFHAPSLVLIDVALLGTLPARERIAGLAEVYKCARVGDGDLLRLLRAGPPADEAAWVECIRRAVAVKARLVEADERDLGARRLLNYGHTVGHALETLLGNEALRHGEAVAVGMQVAARIANARGLLTADAVSRQAEDLRGLGLDPALPAGAGAPAILGQVGADKKRTAGAVHTFVLPTDDEAGVRVVEDVTDAEIRAALA
jgi:3-dehydroquinate synthetase